MNNRRFAISVLGLSSLLCCGCSTATKPVEQPRAVVQVQDNPIPGTVSEEWEEPMYDQVKVPGQLDPTGTYYRNPHNAVVEIRSGRYQEVQFPDDKSPPANQAKPGN